MCVQLIALPNDALPSFIDALIISSDADVVCK